MDASIDLPSIRGELAAALRATARLKALGEDFPALARNAARALASLKMLELNLPDLYELGMATETHPEQTAAGEDPNAAGGPGRAER